MFRKLTFVLTLAALLAPTTAQRASAQGPRFRRTIVVNPVPGNPIRSGNRLLASLSRASSATAADPLLVIVEAGVYDVAGDTVTMVPFVDIEGSGQGVTTITGFAASHVLEGAADSELRNLTVVHRGPGGGVIRNGADRFSMHRVTALGRGGAQYGVSNSGDFADMSELTVRVEDADGGSGIVTNGADGSWKCIRVSVRGTGISYALFNYGGGEFTDIVAEAESTTAFAGGIRNEGPAASPTLRDVRARAEGTIAQAITNGGSSSARLYDVVAEAVATSQFAVGISNQFGSPTLKNVDVHATGVLGASGVANLYGATVTMYEVSAIATGGSLGSGLLSDESTSFAHNSTFKGDFSVDLRFDASAAATLGSSQLDGPVRPGIGTLKCVSSYNGAFDPLTSACTP